MGKVAAWIDGRLLQPVVKLAASQPFILGTLALLPPLIIWKRDEVFVLLANSWTNVMSAVVSMIVLRESRKGHRKTHELHAELHRRLGAAEAPAPNGTKPACAGCGGHL